jgi:hypothetical protein
MRSRAATHQSDRVDRGHGPVQRKAPDLTSRPAFRARFSCHRGSPRSVRVRSVASSSSSRPRARKWQAGFPEMEQLIGGPVTCPDVIWLLSRRGTLASFQRRERRADEHALARGAAAVVGPSSGGPTRRPAGHEARGARRTGSRAFERSLTPSRATCGRRRCVS